MRLGMIAVFAVGFGPMAFAQRGLNPIGNNGNVINPGVPLTGPSPVVRGPAFGSLPSLGQLPTLGIPSINSGFAQRSVGGAPQNRSGNFGRGAGRRGYGYGGGAVLPVPVYGGYNGGGYIGGYGTVHNPPPGQYDPIFGGYNPGMVYGSGAEYLEQQSPTVIINQNFQPEAVHPVIHDYTNVRLPAPGRGPAPQAEAPSPDAASSDAPPAGGGGLGDQQPLYLIAMNDHTIYPALAYWVEKDTLIYVTIQGTPNRVSVSLVDRALSQRLNEERGLPFRLPALP